MLCVSSQAQSTNMKTIAVAKITGFVEWTRPESRQISVAGIEFSLAGDAIVSPKDLVELHASLDEKGTWHARIELHLSNPAESGAASSIPTSATAPSPAPAPSPVATPSFLRSVTTAPQASAPAPSTAQAAGPASAPFPASAHNLSRAQRFAMASRSAAPSPAPARAPLASPTPSSRPVFDSSFEDEDIPF